MTFASFRRAGLALAAVCTVVTATAHLEWQQTEFAGETKPLQSEFEVTFPFRNGGSNPVTIRAIHTNCDCLSATADQTSPYAPGASGLVRARFTVGDRFGTYQRAITVVTDDGRPPQKLTVRLEVPEIAAVEPRVSEWRIGDPVAEKSVEIRSAAGVTLTFHEAMSSNASFQVRLEEVVAGAHYRVHFAPAATTGPANAAIRVKGKAPDGREVVVNAYANVR